MLTLRRHLFIVLNCIDVIPEVDVNFCVRDLLIGLNSCTVIQEVVPYLPRVRICEFQIPKLLAKLLFEAAPPRRLDRPTPRPSSQASPLNVPSFKKGAGVWRFSRTRSLYIPGECSEPAITFLQYENTCDQHGVV